MEPIDKDLIIKEIPLFAGLSERECALIKEKSKFVEYKKGQHIYEEGSPPSAFYYVILGRVVIHTQDRYGNKKILEYLHRGKYFGIISLLTNEPHSVTAEALNDCLILAINKDDFNIILKKIPRIAIDLSQTLSRRLKRKDIHQKTIFESTIISIFSSYSHAGKTIYALNLSLSLAKETHKSVIILDIAPPDKIHTLPQKLNIGAWRIFNLTGAAVINPAMLKELTLTSGFGIDLICFNYQPDDESCVRKLLAILSLLVNYYHFLILDLPTSIDRTVLGMLNQSDIIHLLTSPADDDLRSTHNLIERLVTGFNFQEEKIKIIINEYKLSKLTYEEEIKILNRKIFATLPKIEFEFTNRLVLDEPNCEYAKATRRIARSIGENLVGLVLGVGVAYGLCHIGVLKVIEEEKIPIDIIAGSSIGAFIAALWSTGKSSEEILAITKDFKEPRHIRRLIDLTIPVRGFIKGNKLYKFFRQYLEDKTFYDTKIPLKIIAADVKRRESKILDKGLLVDAIMASCSIPGVFAPFKMKEEMLFDGGVTNPLPTEALLKMGVNKIIAVNVTPSRDDILRQYEKIKGQISAPKKEPTAKTGLFAPFKINIVDIIFSSIEILQSEVAQTEAQLADVVLHPDTSGLYWLDLHKGIEFAKRGEIEARRQLDRIWKVINE